LQYLLNDSTKQRILEAIAKLDTSKDWSLTLGPWKDKRSLDQNARLWKLHSMAAEITGHSPEEMHEFALCRHFGYEEKSCGGIVRRIPLKRSSTRDKAEFSAFMEATESWYGSEFGVWLM